MRLVRHAAGIVEMRGAYRSLVGTSEGKRPLGRPRHKWECNINVYLKDVA
jgi:hypothetical protein